MPKPSNTKLHVLEGKVTHGIGTHETIFVEVEQNAENAELIIHRHNWPVHTDIVLHAQLWVSYDSGRKWHLMIGFGTGGGIAETDYSSCRRKMKPQYKTHKRLLKAIIDCKIPLTIESKIEVW